MTENNVLNKNKTSESIKLLTVSAVLAALCYVLTAYLHVPTNNGITHVGDGIIFLAASMLPLPYAAAVGAVGAGLADLLSGYAVWMPATLVIKAVTACFFSRKGEMIINIRNIIALVPALLLCAGGYTVYEALVIDDWKTAVVAIPSYCVQIGASTILYILLGLSLDRINFKKKFLG